MSFYTMADNNVPISANRDGALYNVALSNQSFIIKGLGDELEPSVDGLQFSVGTGIAVLHGRHITSQLITSDNTITLPPNSSGYVVMRLDLSRPLGTEAYLFATPTLTQEEINWNGIIYDMPVATFNSTLTNATIVDKRLIIEDVGEAIKKLLPKINLLKPTLQTSTINGITCTKNNDGTYTFNGTATSDAVFTFGNDINLIVGTTYKVFDTASGGSPSTYYGGWAYHDLDYGNGIISVKDANIREFQFTIKSGVSVNNLVVKPMCTTDLDATIDDFVSYDASISVNNNFNLLGLDRYRILGTNLTSYTATEDVFVIMTTNNQWGNLYIDGEVVLSYGGAMGSAGNVAWCIACKGQQVRSANATRFTIYGLKH